jgi:hypothetical protein
MAYYQYTVKYLCGDGDNIVLPSGVYRTAINIHNPYDFVQRPVCWKVVSLVSTGAPTLQPSPPLPWQPTFELPPDGGVEINCTHITPLAGTFTGFVVIRSPNELDVVAVYTVERPDQPGIQLEIETIKPRMIQTDQEMCPHQP